MVCLESGIEPSVPKTWLGAAPRRGRRHPRRLCVSPAGWRLIFNGRRKQQQRDRAKRAPPGAGAKRRQQYAGSGRHRDPKRR